MNKNVLVTGATGAIGFEIAKTFQDNGYNVFLTGRKKEKLDKIKDAFSGATIKTLIDKEIIEVSDASKEILAKEFDHDTNSGTPNKALQDFKINEFIDFTLGEISI